MPVTPEQIKIFMAAADAAIRKPYYAELDAKWQQHHGENYAAPLRAEYGAKNARIVSETAGQPSVYCFVRLEDGAILKSASWKTPAKGVRGWIHKGLAGLTPNGAAYAR